MQPQQGWQGQEGAPASSQGGPPPSLMMMGPQNQIFGFPPMSGGPPGPPGGQSGGGQQVAMGWPNSMMNNMQNMAAFPPSTLAYMPWFPQMAQMGQLGMAYPGMGAIPAVAAGGATGPVLGGSDDAQRKRRERDETNMKWASLDALAPPASCEPAHPHRAGPRYRAFITPLPHFPAPTPRAMAKPELTELSSAAPACSDPGWQPITVTSFGAYQTRGT